MYIYISLKMNAKQFFDRVTIMRKYQKEYFRTRSQAALKLSKALELEIDAEITRVNALMEKEQKEPIQKNLFEEDLK